MEYLIIIVVVVFALSFFGEDPKKKIEKTLEKTNEIVDSILKSLPDFDVTQHVIDYSRGLDFVSGLAIDEEKKKICLINIDTRNSSSTSRIISYKDILSVEFIHDGISVTKTVRSSQIGGAVVGGLLLGGTGAIIGGLSGTTNTSEKVKHIALRLTLNDINAPLYDVVFLRNLRVSVESDTYKQVSQQARHWYGIIEVIIKRTNEEENNLQSIKYQKPTVASNTFVADEIKKLAELHNSGLLTSEEFQQQKSKLLGIVDIQKAVKHEPKDSVASPLCPKCHIAMQIRTALKGEHQGKQFYVCSNYPNCRETRKITQ